RLCGLCGRMGISWRARTAGVVPGTARALAGDRVQGEGPAGGTARLGRDRDARLLRRDEHGDDGGGVSDRGDPLALDELWRQRDPDHDGRSGAALEHQAPAAVAVLLVGLAWPGRPPYAPDLRKASSGALDIVR